MASWLRFAPIVAVVLVLLGLGSAVTVSHLEENNVFCTICHLPQETEYVQRAEMAGGQPNRSTDLASFHFAKGITTTTGTQPFDCVACHRGDQGLADRAQSLSLGALNTVKWIAGEHGQHGPATVRALPDASCEGCHQEIYRDKTFNNHFHAYLIDYRSKPQVLANPATNTLYCADCHKPHDMGSLDQGFMNQNVTFGTCEKCHQVWGRGPQRLRRS